MLRAVAASRLFICKVERHHEITDVILSDLIRGDEVWLVDEAFGCVAKPGWINAMRLLPVAEFMITGGTLVPMDDEALVADVTDRLTWVKGSDKDRMCRSAFSDRHVSCSIAAPRAGPGPLSLDG